MRSIRKWAAAVVAGFFSLGAGSVALAIPYSFSGEAGYGAGGCPSAGIVVTDTGSWSGAGDGCAIPDTSFVLFRNTGLSTFVGTITLAGIKGDGSGLVNETFTGSLAPG